MVAISENFICLFPFIECVLAQALADESMGQGYNIVNKKDFIRHKYIELAKDLIAKLERHDLNIIHKNTPGVTDNEKE